MISIGFVVPLPLKNCIRLKAFVLFILSALTLSSCSESLENVGTLSIPSLGRDTLIFREATMHLNKGDVVQLWNDMLIQTVLKDDVNVSYRLEQFVNGKLLSEIRIDALKTDPTIESVEERTRGRLILGFQGRMTDLNIDETGDYTFKANLISNDSLLIVDRAKLVFKRQIK